MVTIEQWKIFYNQGTITDRYNHFTNSATIYFTNTGTMSAGNNTVVISHGDNIIYQILEQYQWYKCNNNKHWNNYNYI